MPGILVKKGQKKGQFLILASEATKATPLAWPASCELSRLARFITS